MEVLDLLADARACNHAVLVEEDATGVRRVITARPDSASDLNATRSPQGTGIPLGTLGERSYEVLVAPSASPTARATVIAVERMAHASVTLTAMRRDERERTSLWPEQSPEEQLGLVCASEAMVELVKTTRRVAPSNVTVLITGETGAGKEVIARALHQASGRQRHAFMPFNCTTVPREMLDAQLFGYRRGAFTGAVEEFSGLIRAAEGGTLFLDEIGEMPTELQPKLLRFLESGEILPLGETRPIRVDVRIVAATNADLDQLVNEGRFREDLFYRLNVVRLRVPPLRERREEVPLLVQAHLERVARETQRDPIRVSRRSHGVSVALPLARQCAPAGQRAATALRAGGARRPGDARAPVAGDCQQPASGGRRAGLEWIRAAGPDRSAVVRRHRARGTGVDRAGARSMSGQSRTRRPDTGPVAQGAVSEAAAAGAVLVQAPPHHGRG